MNREILFRGRRTDNGDWVEGYLLYDSDKPYIVTWCGGDVTRCWDCGTPHMDYFEVDPATIGQYTGLTDKNGKRIFEGDVIKTHYANAKNANHVETVVFHKGKFMASGTVGDTGKCWAPLADGTPRVHYDKSVYMDEMEVIGTTHDKEAPHDRTTD